MSSSHERCAHCGDCNSDIDEDLYMYRDLKGEATFTGFVRNDSGVFWVGKDEQAIRRPIVTDTDRQFFMTEMRQYD